MADLHRSAATLAAIDTSLIQQLLEPSAYPHPVSAVRMIETHISWVLLTGDYVYKIKKPVDLGFLDFSDLERRHFFCTEEIRLNKPWAPDIYLDVVPITQVDGHAAIDGAGVAIEYAVRMRSFDQALLLDAQLEAGKLTVADMRELANALATRHRCAQRTAESQRAHTVSRAIELIRENFPPLAGSIDTKLLNELQDWTTRQLETIEPVFLQRFDAGFFRECHGDLHLGNLVRLADGITTFDCIEFSEDLRNTDVVADIAFLIMDLVARQKLDLAAHFLNRYLEFSGDYDGIRVFNLYFTYRCLVRAKIAVIQGMERQDGELARHDIDEAHRYCSMAQRQIASRTPVLVAMSGLSGSGKTWVSEKLMAALPAIRVRSDIERKRMLGLEETADSQSSPGAGIYTRDVNSRTYSRLNEIAALLLSSGHNVILDASCLKVAQRDAARATAAEQRSGFVIVETVADKAVLQSRIKTRQAGRADASEADVEVLDYQMQNAEIIAESEQRDVVRVDSANLDVAQTVKRIRDRAGVRS